MIVFDPGGGFEVTDEWLHSMNHVTDPDGRTCVTSDYPQGAWPDVWGKHVARIHELSQMGEFAFLLCDEVEYACRACDGIDAHESVRIRATFEEWVHAPSGKLVIADAMAAFSGLDMSDEPLAELKVSSGWNKVTVYHIQEPDMVAPIIGFEGTTIYPAISFVVTPSATPPDFRTPRIVSRINAPRLPEPGILCEATVSASDDETVKLRLRQSHSTHSAHARMTAPTSVRLHPGDEVRVRLLENKGAYWRVELA